MIQQLSAFAIQLRANPGCNVTIGTMAVSGKRFAQLSWDRVNAVVKYLIKKKVISEERLLFGFNIEADANTVGLIATNKKRPDLIPVPHPNFRQLKR